MTRRYGRAVRGEPVRQATPAGHWSTLTLRVAMGEEGLLAIMIVESPTDEDVLGGIWDRCCVPSFQLKSCLSHLHLLS